MPHSNTTHDSVSRLAQAGAIAYIIWALLHFQASWAVYQVADSMLEGMARGRVLQDAWFLMCSSVAALIVAVSLNWRNDVRGWWLNLAIISVVDLGFIFFVFDSWLHSALAWPRRSIVLGFRSYPLKSCAT